MSNNYIKKQAFDYELIASCFHESAHVVMALHNYFRVFNVNIFSPKRREANTDYYVYNYAGDNELIKHKFLTLELETFYAGLIGEKIYYKDICGSSKFPMHLKIGSSFDTNSASNIIRENLMALPGKPTLMFKQEIRSNVEKIILDNWDAVKALSHALYQKKRLTFDELKYILTRKTENREFWKDKFKKIKLIHSESITEEEAISLIQSL